MIIRSVYDELWRELLLHAAQSTDRELLATGKYDRSGQTWHEYADAHTRLEPADRILVAVTSAMCSTGSCGKRLRTSGTCEPAGAGCRL